MRMMVVISIEKGMHSIRIVSVRVIAVRITELLVLHKLSTTQKYISSVENQAVISVSIPLSAGVSPVRRSDQSLQWPV